MRIAANARVFCALLSVLGAAGCSVTRSEGASPPSDTENGFKTGLPYNEPPSLMGSNGVLNIALQAQPTELLVSGRQVSGEAYNGVFVGPTLMLEPGDEIRLMLINQLKQPTNVHFHGFHTSPSGLSDNVLRHIPAGTTGDYVVKVPRDHDQGVFWYHSHLHMDSESQVFQGLSGAIIIGDTRRLLPERFRKIPTRLLALKDLQVKNGAILAANINSDAPTTRTVNGLVDPVMTVQPGATELWQIANISADIFYDVEVEGVNMLVTGEDGNPVERTFLAKHLVMPPGKRWEVLVEFPREIETNFITRAYDQGGDMYPETELAHVVVTGKPVTQIESLGEDQMVAPMVSDILTRPVAEKRTWTFSEDDETSEFFINKKQFDPKRVDVSPTLDTVEEWTLKNDTSEQHPFHIHVNDFKVLSVNGKRYDSRGEQDTVVLRPHESVVVRIPFDDFTGKFVFHCHILNHEDNGMMALVDVVE